MKLDQSMTTEEIASLLQDQANRVYGAERADEIASQIEHLSLMLFEVARRERDILDPGPGTSDDAKRSHR